MTARAEVEPDLKIKEVKRIEIHVIRLPLIRAFTTSFGTQTHKEALLVKVCSAEGCGWGECVASPEPYYSYETNKTALTIIKDYLIPILKDHKNFHLPEIMNGYRQIRGYRMAKATLENALLDLLARAKDKSLYELIGGEHKKIMSGISIGIQKDLPALLDVIDRACRKKYRRIKIKIKKGKDIEMIEAVRRHFPDIKLMADANADYTIDDLDLIKQFDRFDLMMVEQPLEHDDIYFHSLVQKAIKTPVCLDESIKNLNDAKAAIKLGSCRVINIKQGRVGGILASRAIQQYCRENDIPCWSGGMLETGIGRAFNLHLQTLPGFTLPGDTSETSRYFQEDIVDRPVVLDENGFIDLPRGPGTGVEVIPEKLKKFTVFYEHII